MLLNLLQKRQKSFKFANGSNWYAKPGQFPEGYETFFGIETKFFLFAFSHMKSS